MDRDEKRRTPVKMVNFGNMYFDTYPLQDEEADGSDDEKDDSDDVQDDVNPDDFNKTSG